MYKLSHCLSALFLLFGITSTHAATTYYHSQADYLTALGASSTITYNFDASAAGTIIASGDTLNGATFSYALLPALLGDPDPSIMIDTGFDTTSLNNYLATDDGSGAFIGGDEFTITFDQTMRAVGLYVISADLIFSDDFSITTSSGQNVSNTATIDVVLADGDAYYLGLIEDDFNQGFDSITLSSLDANFQFNVDDITVSAVPLPTAVWLMGSGLLCLAGIARRSIHKS
jgi:hypothetical protein